MARREEHEEQATLTAIQEKAVMMMASGKTITATAEALGITRQTVSAWVNKDPEFISALNTLRAEMLDSGADRLRGMVTKALDAMEAAFDSEDLNAKERARLALELLQQMRLTDAASRTGSTSPEEIRRVQALDDLINSVY